MRTVQLGWSSALQGLTYCNSKIVFLSNLDSIILNEFWRYYFFLPKNITGSDTPCALLETNSPTPKLTTPTLNSWLKMDLSMLPIWKDSWSPRRKKKRNKYNLGHYLPPTLPSRISYYLNTYIIYHILPYICHPNY